jgi:gamma-glutamyltranspeptidase/glutathione hydrolase
MALRGIYALFSRHGVKNWSELVAPAERLARFGAPTSRAFAKDVEAHADFLYNNPRLRAYFSAPDGRLIGEGDSLEQVALGAVLSAIRFRGPGVFYTGENAQRLVEEVQAAGGTLTMEDLATVTPVWREPYRVEFGNDVLFYTDPPLRNTSSGIINVEDLADESSDAFAADAANRLRAILERPSEGFPMGRDGFLVTDRWGNAVACEVTLGRRFGSNRLLPGFGFLLADGAPAAIQRPDVGPALLTNEFSKLFRYGVASTGGRDGDAAAMMRTIDILAGEVSGPAVSQLREIADRDSLVSSIRCEDGLPVVPSLCSFAIDPKSHGLSTNGL